MKFKKILSATLATVMAASVISVGMVSVASAAVISSDATLTFSEQDVTDYGTAQSERDIPFVNDQFTCHFLAKSTIYAFGVDVDGTTYPGEFRTSGKAGYIQFEIDRPATVTIGARSSAKTTNTDRYVYVYDSSGTALNPDGYLPNPLDGSNADNKTYPLSDPITLPEKGVYKIQSNATVNYFLVKVTFDGGDTPGGGDTPPTGKITLAQTDDKQYVVVGVDKTEGFAESIPQITINENGKAVDGVDPIQTVYDSVNGIETLPEAVNGQYVFAYLVGALNGSHTITANGGEGIESNSLTLAPADNGGGEEPGTSSAPDNIGPGTNFDIAGADTQAELKAKFQEVGQDKDFTYGVITINANDVDKGHIKLGDGNFIQFKVNEACTAEISVENHDAKITPVAPAGESIPLAKGTASATLVSGTTYKIEVGTAGNHTDITNIKFN